MSAVYWPWWAGALGLSGMTIGYYLVVGRTVGVSGAWERVLNWREERAVEAADAAVGDEDAFAAALAAATQEAFGPSANTSIFATHAPPATLSRATQESGTAAGGMVTHPMATAAPTAATTPADSAGGRIPVAFQAVFLLSIFLGGLAAALTSGTFKLRGDMGPAFADIVIDGPLMWPVLFVGGLLVGFGTRYAGGCSSGHGLSGCGRLQLSSIVATAVFFGTAVVVSTLLWKVI